MELEKERSGNTSDNKTKEVENKTPPLLNKIVAHKSWLTLLALFLVFEIVYVGYVSVWQWSNWPETTKYYGLLAKAFRNGQLALLEEPSPELAQLENPYDRESRRGIDYLWDASYFDGNYYLYWGPVPAVFATIREAVTGQATGDEEVVFLAASGIFVFSSLVLFDLKSKYFPDLKQWQLVIGILIVGSVFPILWILNWPTIYPAAIACGQAFLIAGLYIAIPIIDGSDHAIWRFFLVGLLSSLAILTRATLVFATAIILGSSVLSLLRSKSKWHRWKQNLVRSSAILLPLVTSILVFALYNFLRFGNIFETGLRFQLSAYDLNRLIVNGTLFNPKYILPNLIYYLFTPVRLSTTFPFLRPIFGEISIFSDILQSVNVLPSHHVEITSGLLFMMPTLLLIFIGSREILCQHAVNSRLGNRKPTDSPNNFRITKLYTVLAVILLAGVFAMLPTIAYFWVSSRFLLDATPLFAIVAAIASWLLFRSSRGMPIRSTIVNLLVISIVTLAVLTNILLAISGKGSRFDDLNPELYQNLLDLFSW